MSHPAPVYVSADSQSQDEEWVFTVTNGIVRKIERIDNTTQTRTELSADEYEAIGTSYYVLYYLGIHDYVNAIASGNMELAEAYYQGMIAFFGALAQKYGPSA